MIIDASRDVSLMAMALYYWPWLAALGLAIANFIIIFLVRRRRQATMLARLPQFFYDEKEDYYYYEYPGEASAWVRKGEPRLPPDYHYDEDKGRFFFDNGQQEPRWIKPEEMGWDANYGRSAIGCWPAIILVVGTITTLVFIGDIQDSMPDPRGLQHRLEVMTMGEDEDGEPEIKTEVLGYRPGDSFRDARGRIIELPVLPQPEFRDGRPDYGARPTFWINNTDRLITYNRYQYETAPMMCGGGDDGALTFALLPFEIYAEVPGYGGYGGPAGRPPAGVTTYIYAGCTSILYRGFGPEPYDPATDPVPPESAAEVNAGWLAGQAEARAAAEEREAADQALENEEF